jgi:hypothetical protein
MLFATIQQLLPHLPRAGPCPVQLPQSHWKTRSMAGLSVNQSGISQSCFTSVERHHTSISRLRLVSLSKGQTDTWSVGRWTPYPKQDCGDDRDSTIYYSASVASYHHQHPIKQTCHNSAGCDCAMMVTNDASIAASKGVVVVMPVNPLASMKKCVVLLTCLGKMLAVQQHVVLILNTTRIAQWACSQCTWPS